MATRESWFVTIAVDPVEVRKKTCAAVKKRKWQIRLILNLFVFQNLISDF